MSMFPRRGGTTLAIDSDVIARGDVEDVLIVADSYRSRPKEAPSVLSHGYSSSLVFRGAQNPVHRHCILCLR